MAKMDPDKFLTTVEMREIAQLCELFDKTAKAIDETNVSVSLFVNDIGEGLTHTVFDSNGEVLGRIGYGPDGFVLYLDTREPKNDG